MIIVVLDCCADGRDTRSAQLWELTLCIYLQTTQYTFCLGADVDNTTANSEYRKTDLGNRVDFINMRALVAGDRGVRDECARTVDLEF